MGVVLESEVWEPNKPLYVFIFVSCFLSIYFSPHSAKRVMEGFWSVFGEYEWSYYEVSRERMVLFLCSGCAASLCIGTFLGVVSDLVGQRKVCLLFYALHLFVAFLKRITVHPNIWFASICLSVASSIFSFSFETWMVVEHDKLGQRQDTLNDMLWLMTFAEAASVIGSQVLGNWLIGSNPNQNMVRLYNVAVLLAIASFIIGAYKSQEAPQTSTLKDYWTSFQKYVFADKRIWLLLWSQACMHLSNAVFWILWAPTIVADGREVKLGYIFPCLLGARMLGSTAFPWFLNGIISLRTEDCLVYAFPVMGLVLSMVAYDYQDIGVLLVLFCIFHACVGLVLPSLARLRSMYVPNELRGGMMSLSQAPANTMFLFFLMHGGYFRNIGNSTIIAFAALCLFSAAGCMHILKQSGKQLHQSWHKL